MKTAEMVLREIPFLQSYKGYQELILCLRLVLEDEERLTDIRKQVYLAAAVQRGEGLHNFEKNLRTVRDAFLMYGGKEYLERVLKRKIQLPLDSRELIEVLVECMRRG